jgi:hypothetical protein
MSQLKNTETGVVFLNEELARRHYAQFTFNTTGECISLDPESQTLLDELLAVGYAVYVEPASVPIDIQDQRANMRISMRQLRIMLVRAGMYEGVVTAIAAAGVEAQMEWEYASYIDRLHPLVASITALETLTELQVDAMFAYAATI